MINELDFAHTKGPFTWTINGQRVAFLDTAGFSGQLRNGGINVKDAPYSALGDGSTVDTARVSAALSAATAGQRISVPEGVYPVSGLSTSDSTPVVIEGVGRKSELKKIANGALMTLGKNGVLDGLYLNGNGAAYTGIGVDIPTGGLTDTNASRYLLNGWIEDTASYCVEVSAANAGYATVICNMKLLPRSTSTAAVKLTVTGETNGNRTLLNVFTGSSPIIDFGASDNTQVVCCQGGEPIYASNTLKAVVAGSRIVSSSGTLTFDGQYNVIAETTISTNVTFSATLQYSWFMGCPISGTPTIIDNAPGVSVGNELYLPYKTFTPTWTGNTGNPAAGSASFAGSGYKRNGMYADVTLNVVMAADTTFGAGFWILGLGVYTSTNRELGEWYAKDVSTGNEYTGRCVTEAGAGTVVLLTNASPATKVDATTPFAWATSDILAVKIRFPIN